MKLINIFWVDDQHESFLDFKKVALDKGFKLNGFASYESGRKEFIKNYKNYDAVILDARFKEKDNDAEQNVNDDWCGELLTVIQETIGDKYWIGLYTGFVQQGMISKIFKGRVYNKTSPKDQGYQMLEEIKKWYKSKDEFKIKKKYSKTFEIFNEKYIGGVYENDLLSMIKDKNNIKDKQETIRKIIEAVHTLYIKKGLLPPDSKKLFSANMINRFISGLDVTIKDNEEVTYVLNDEFIPPKFFNEISRAIWKLSLIPLHHQEDPEVDRFYNENLNFQYGMVMMLCDYLVYIKHYVDKHPDGAEWKIKKNKN